MSLNQKNIILMDINSHIHRAYHVSISQEDNKKQGAYFNNRPNYIIKRAISIIEKEIKKIGVEADYIACILDADGKKLFDTNYIQNIKLHAHLQTKNLTSCVIVFTKSFR